ncbi:hypothetical protein [Streptomyces olivochromogenes]|uniref:Uncharacterized protein n=1 Tax=Streptomyces olivochromogenes TaxID=1963 RepID=A0A250VVJ1_STROL|nr:hypothetical protein [Streptomyces olivochromogenes]KUN36181.1 hypothetical protein AQJ27_46890 [Streptomyces olivochromogenes]GAX58237.1 hypothetical protein SO3561_09808 [Streptomyces olivochromogenes]
MSDGFTTRVEQPSGPVYLAARRRMSRSISSSRTSLRKAAISASFTDSATASDRSAFSAVLIHCRSVS